MGLTISEGHDIVRALGRTGMGQMAGVLLNLPDASAKLRPARRHFPHDGKRPSPLARRGPWCVL